MVAIRKRHWAIIGLPVALATLGIAEMSTASDQFLTDCRELAKGPHRLTGTDEYRRAAQYVERRLKQIGPDRVVVQEFATTQTRIKRCEILMDEPSGHKRRLALVPMRPNGIIAPVSGPEGITGPIYHAGQGRAEDFKDRSPRGCIVVLDYNSDRGWIRAFRLGAKAVIFVKSGLAQAWQTHYVEANANIPRFYYPGPGEDLVDGSTGTIHSEIVWERVGGRNVFAFIRGTEPTFSMGKEEVIVITANLDSFGEVPRLSPSARGAANCAALIKLAGYLKDNRPRRHLLLGFLDAQARGHAGACAFYRALDEKEVNLKDLQEYLDLEKQFMVSLKNLLDQDDPVRKPRSSVHREMMNRLKIKGAEHAFNITAILYDLRKEAAGLDRNSDRYRTLRRRIESEQREKDRWNDLRRALARNRGLEEVKDKLAIVLDEVRSDIQIRTGQLDFEQRALNGDRDLRDLVGDCWVSLHVSLLLGDTTGRWGLVVGGDSCMHSAKDNPGLYGKIQGTFLAAYRSLEQAGKAPGNFETASADGTLNPPRLLLAAPFLVHGGEVAGKLGIYNLALCTAQERLSREGTPDDTLEHLNLARLEAQASEIGLLLANVASQEGLSQPSSIERDTQYVLPSFGSDNRPRGAMVMAKTPGSSMPNKPMPGAIIQLVPWRRIHYDYWPKKIYAFDNFQVLQSDHNGSYSFGPTQKDSGGRETSGFAAAFDERGLAWYASTLASETLVRERLNMFPCRHGAVLMAPLLETVEPAKVLDGTANSLLDKERSYSATADGVIYWYCEEKIEGIKLFGLQSAVALVNGSETLQPGHKKISENEASEGNGLPPETLSMVISPSKRSGADLWRLNESRIEILRAKRVMSSSLEELHGRAEDLLYAAKRSPSATEGEALAASAFMMERPVYTETRQTLDDLVRAVLVLLALSVPFSFALERLLIGSTNIYRQIMWFVFIFTTTFLVLYFSHPAFAVSKTPIIIFLGFAVVVLSSLVIFIIMRKFEIELKVLQGLTSTVHAADVSRFGTIMAAMSMGISTMRRRPLRTALTAVTIILLTFTILCFASFGTRTGIIKLFVAAPPPYSGVMIHQVNWAQLNPDVLDVIQGRWAGKARIFRRYWLSPETETSQGPLITRQDGTKPIALQGVLGLDGGELQFRSDLGKLLGVGSQLPKNTVWMTSAVAGHLGVKPGDHVLVGGLRLRAGKLLDAAQVSVAKDMDGSDILPVDFVEMRSSGMDRDVLEDVVALQYRQNWATLPVDSVVIVGTDAAIAMGGTLRAITLYTGKVEAATDVAEDLARVLPLPVSATRHDGVYRHLLGPIVQASGAKDLLFPVLLGGLVIFGTMLGSVADREREIYTFSALGLAPPHVAGLFFAEAMVYSVLGGLGGYLLAQGAMKILSLLADYGLVNVPEMNYSSTNAVITMLIVMGTVLISAIYPAIKASRSANPGILRTWRLPPPEGDTFNIVFPFTVSAYDITGVVSFLKEHFDNFADVGLGVFMARDTRLVRQADGTVGLDSHLALAPFDLGVTESFELRSTPSEIPGIDEVKIKITRASGQPKDWRRLNKVLLDDLRKQFLIWRSLPNETMEIYRQRTSSEMAERTQETVSTEEPRD